MSSRATAVRATIAISLFAIQPCSAGAGPEEPRGTGVPNIPIISPLLDYAADALDADGDGPPRGFVHWNEFDGRFANIRFGGSFKYDAAGYSQDSASKTQMALSPTAGVRDLRVSFGGRFRFSKRASYVLGYMYDGSSKKWLVRRTGIMIDVPELKGNLFVGRTKEGFSTGKLMIGTQSWSMEGAAVTDALLPELADGVRWTGTIPSGKLVYNLGWYVNTLSQSESFTATGQQFIARTVWLPLAKTDERLLHLAIELRYGSSNDGFLQYRAKPESGLAQSFAIDTGRFPANHATTLGVEAYYRPGALMFGSEYFLDWVSSPETNNPFFHGGEIFAAYLLTKEVRPYNFRGGYFGRISPARPLLSGGPGAWEAVLRFSYADFDSQRIRGGKFWRITPTINWYPSDEVRFDLAYGYGILDRFAEKGATQFIQARFQLQL